MLSAPFISGVIIAAKSRAVTYTPVQIPGATSGFVFGLVTAGLSGTSFLLGNGYYVAAFCLFVALVCGFAAMRYGDAFWHRLPNWWWW
jgi:hypothetical protein